MGLMGIKEGIVVRDAPFYNQVNMERSGKIVG